MFSQGQEIKISVQSSAEIEAPLGGLTVVYNVSIIEGSANSNVTKTYREFEDLAKRLQRKYQNLSFPSLNKISPDSNSRCKAAHQFMTFLAAHSDTISVSLIKQFLGIDSEENYQISTSNPETENEEPEPLFKTVTPKKHQTKPINLNPALERDDLTHEFEASNKILNQQHGRTSFFDYVEEDDDDDDLFKITKPKLPKPETDLKMKKPAAMELFESEGLNKNTTITKELNENKTSSTKTKDIEEIMDSKFDEMELDDSIMNIEDDLDDLKNLSLTPKIVPKEEPQGPQLKSKPVPPPKKPSVMKKPALAPKPGTKPNVTKTTVSNNLDELDINSYINAEQEASQQEAKLFD